MSKNISIVAKGEHEMLYSYSTHVAGKYKGIKYIMPGAFEYSPTTTRHITGYFGMLKGTIEWSVLNGLIEVGIPE